jgi:hypothetical protein
LWNTSFYESKVPPEYKFLDINEVGYLLCRTIIVALGEFFSSNGQITPNNSFLNNGLGMKQSTFLLMLRQQLIYMFADSQCLGQFLVPDVDSNGFQPFVCGSNCFPQEPAGRMKITNALNENLKMLKMVIRPYETKNYNSNKNHVTQIPVWGAFKGYAMLNFTYTNSLDVATNLFLPETDDYPNIWDCSFTDGTVADINASTLIDGAIAFWNEYVTALSVVLSSLDTIGGDSNGSPLLQFTRYVKYTSLDEKIQSLEKVLEPNERVPKMYENCVTQRKKIGRTKSEKDISVDRVLAIPQSTVLSEYPLAISGSIKITPTHKEFFPDLILPVMDSISTDGVPSQSQIQIALMEPYSLTKNHIDGFFNNRAQELENSLPNHIVGIAGRKTSLCLYLDAMSKTGHGAFLGDLFSTAGDIANVFGFSGVGAVAKGIGGVANAIGI